MMHTCRGHEIDKNVAKYRSERELCIFMSKRHHFLIPDITF